MNSDEIQDSMFICMEASAQVFFSIIHTPSTAFQCHLQYVVHILGGQTQVSQCVSITIQMKHDLHHTPLNIHPSLSSCFNCTPLLQIGLFPRRYGAVKETKETALCQAQSSLFLSEDNPLSTPKPPRNISLIAFNH